MADLTAAPASADASLHSLDVGHGNSAEQDVSQHAQPSSSIALSTTATIMPPLLLRIPNAAFGIGLGLGAHSILWKTAGSTNYTSSEGLIKPLIASTVPNKAFWVATACVSSIVAGCYCCKCLSRWDLVRAEWNHPVRAHFFNAPHVILIMLGISLPTDYTDSLETLLPLRVMWTVAALLQLLITERIYRRWMFSADKNISVARPQFLLSTVGWFLLSVFGQLAEIRQTWGISLEAMCFGAGTAFYIMVLISVFNGLHSHRSEAEGNPALFMLIAPPAVASVAISLFDNGNFGNVPAAVLGWCLVVLILLLEIGPRILETPQVLGCYWAYVFPLASLANAGVSYAQSEQTKASFVLAIILIILAVISLIAVFIRMCWHQVNVWRGHAVWTDSLFIEVPLTAATVTHGLNGSTDRGESQRGSDEIDAPVTDD